MASIHFLPILRFSSFITAVTANWPALSLASPEAWSLLVMSTRSPQFPAKAISSTHVTRPPSLMSWPAVSFRSAQKTHLVWKQKQSMQRQQNPSKLSSTQKEMKKIAQHSTESMSISQAVLFYIKEILLLSCVMLKHFVCKIKQSIQLDTYGHTDKMSHNLC